MMRRTGVFYLAMVAALIGIIFRVFWLSIGENAVRAEAVMANRESEIILYRTKGLIYDENLNPLAGNQPCWYLLVDPRNFQSDNLDLLIEMTESNREQVQNKLKKETPFVLKTKTDPKALPGVQVFEGVDRYCGLASHLLGYLDSAGEVGLSGVEKEYNEFLNLFSSSVCVSYNSDALHGAISGLGVEAVEAETSENGLVLTLNKEICEVLDQSMENYIEKGAAIVMDCKTGAIKAVSSMPDFDADAVSSYLDSGEGELINRAFSSQTVGSVFKIILAACALENGMEDFLYTCNGGIVINDRTFACHNHDGHGEIGLQEAFAQSCNAYFIALGQLLGYDSIAEMAERFGYGSSITILDSMKTSTGNFPVKSSNLALANLSIGQGELMASPMQIAMMTAIIANGGILPDVHLYNGIYLNGKLKANTENTEEKRVISAEHAEMLRQFCVYTVEEGTGKSAKPSSGSAGGKTSSAQTGVIVNGVEKLNVYFTGFYPAENPEYVITVFAEGGESGGKTCGPVFREVCDFLAS
ncbi:MAG: penicillin-binding protein 2 [Clostridia bacterium]|nr:penicillin-binding protein 2 [Clostridia bacterium]